MNLLKKQFSDMLLLSKSLSLKYKVVIFVPYYINRNSEKDNVGA